MIEKINALIEIYTKDKYDLVIDIKKRIKTIEEFREDALNTVNEFYPDEDSGKLIDKLISVLFGYSEIDDLIEDELVTDIKILDEKTVIVKRKGHREEENTSFENYDRYAHFIDNVITKNGINLSNVNGIQRFSDVDTSSDYILRFTLLHKIIVSGKKPILIIRKVPKDFPLMDDLVNENMMTEETKNILIRDWKNGSMLICGGNSSGKTTLLNALKEETPMDEALLVIQQAEELSKKKHKDTIFLHSLEGISESDIHYTLKELTIAVLTSDVDRVIIGEIKGDEAGYLLNASYSGQKCAGTIHSLSSTTGVDKAIDYALHNPQNSYIKSELLEMFAYSFKTVVFMEHYKVKEISTILGIENGRIQYETKIF